MPLFSSTQPSLRARILPKFPAQVLAGTGITITKTNGVYTFAVALSNIPLSALESIDAARLVGRDVGVGVPQEIAVSGGLGFTGSNSIELTANQRLRGLVVHFDTLGVGAKKDLLVPISGTIFRATLLADQAGDVVVDIWKDTYANYPPVVADSITASAKPTLSGVDKSQDNTLTGWDTDVLAGDVLRFNIDSFSTITRLAVCLDVETL